MHPAWLVPRMTADELKKYNFEVKPPNEHLKFNTTWERQDFTAVAMGKLGESDFGDTWTVSVPILTNTEDVKKGDFLVMESCMRRPSNNQRKPRTWRDDEKKRERENAVPASGAAKRPKKGANSSVEIEL